MSGYSVFIQPHFIQTPVTASATRMIQKPYALMSSMRGILTDDGGTRWRYR